MPDDRPVPAYLALGSNLGDRAAFLDAAVAGLRRTPGITVLAESRRIDTQPVGGAPGQGDYLNSACAILTELSPSRLLAATQAVERSLGRRREEEPARWGPRVIDIDILLYGDTIVEAPDLRIPHPRLAERLFVLEPLAEIAPDVVVPGIGETAGELLRRLRRTDI